MLSRWCATLIVTLLLGVQLVGPGTRAQPAPLHVPTPREVLGFEPGADYQLADFRQLREYFARLAASSPRVKVSVAGRSTDGNDMLVAVISSEENLARLDRYRDIARRLALVEGITPDEARALAREGRAIVWIDSGLHASEVATAQHAIVLADRLATSETPELRAIRENVILVLAPCINPDGMNLVVDWYRKNLKTAYQDSPMPWLYQRYIGHDNNRDFYMQTQAESQVVNRLLYREWFPQVMYNQHQGTWPPRIFVPPFPDPFNPNIDPEVMRGVDLIGGAMQHRFEQENKDGVISRYQFSVWYNGSVRTTSYFHNMIGILTETGHPSATPFTYNSADFPATLSNGVPSLIPSVTYPHPWKGGTLHLRDAVEYMFTGSLAVLDAAGKYREELLNGIYNIGTRQMEAGRRDAPVAYVVPLDQHDQPAAMAFLGTLMKGAVQVHRATRPFVADDMSYPAGTYVVLMAQPFRPFAKDLLEPQHYPDLRAYPGGPPIPPYDTAGWTLSYQMGVHTVAVERPFDTSSLQRLEEPPRADATLNTPLGAREIRAWAIDPAPSVSVRAINALLEAGFHVSRVPARFEPRPGTALPPGTWIVDSPRQTRTRAALEAALRSQTAALGVAAWGLDAPVSHTRAVTRPRIGIYKSYVANIDEGWTRWVLEQYGFPYTSVMNADVRAGGLRARFDVIVLPSQSPSQIMDGHQPGRRPTTPGPWNPPPPEYQGGIGPDGVEALRRFVQDGGRLIALDEASDLVLDRFGGVFESISDPTRGVPRTEFYCPGSVVRIQVDPNQPIGWGMEPDAAAYFEGSRAFTTTAPAGIRSVKYAAADRLLMSGWLLGAPTIAGRDAVLDVPFGRGHVVLFAFRPQFRGQPHGTFKLLFNAILN